MYGNDARHLRVKRRLFKQSELWARQLSQGEGGGDKEPDKGKSRKEGKAGVEGEQKKATIKREMRVNPDGVRKMGGEEWWRKAAGGGAEGEGRQLPRTSSLTEGNTEMTL